MEVCSGMTDFSLPDPPASTVHGLLFQCNDSVHSKMVFILDRFRVSDLGEIIHGKTHKGEKLH